MKDITFVGNMMNYGVCMASLISFKKLYQNNHYIFFLLNVIVCFTYLYRSVYYSFYWHRALQHTYILIKKIETLFGWFKFYYSPNVVVNGIGNRNSIQVSPFICATIPAALLVHIKHLYTYYRSNWTIFKHTTGMINLFFQNISIRVFPIK